MSAAPEGQARAVTTTDLWKAAALVLITIDHLGHFIFPDVDWLRAVGRSGAPIFFFLIGFAGARPVPWFWLAAGALLTGLDLLWERGDASAVTLNILFSFALLRWLAPYAERLFARAGWSVYVVAGLLILSIPFADQALEYGATGPLYALAGLLHRRALISGDRSDWLHRRAIGAAAVLAYAAVEIDAYGFGVPETWAMMILLIAVSGLMLLFRRADLKRQPPDALKPLLGFMGRRTLEIYIGQIVVLLALGMLLGAQPEGDEE